MSARDGIATRSVRIQGGADEHMIAIEAPAGAGFGFQLDALARRYAEAVQSLRLAPSSAVFRRVFLSDAANQAAAVRDSPLGREPGDAVPAVSLVQQPPAEGAKLALLAWHIDDPDGLGQRRHGPGEMLLERNGRGHLWTTGACAGATRAPVPTAAQTEAVFDRLAERLAAGGGSLADNCIRTWIYVRDVDAFYQEMVDARTALFARAGLTRETHYIASTGIAGACAHRYDTVLMDAWSVFGLQPGQVTYLNDFEHLCATHDYQVTFERGTRIAYGDRAHCLISGTASIDVAGQVVHRGDVMRQLDRALENMSALLADGGAGLGDLTHLLTYLRDPADAPWVRAALGERFPGLPVLVLRGAVCRPEWLVEVEGIAVTADRRAGLAPF
ncbi:MAG: Rid family hydrolase [Acetobacteraceae bacterium]